MGMAGGRGNNQAYPSSKHTESHDKDTVTRHAPKGDESSRAANSNQLRSRQGANQGHGRWQEQEASIVRHYTQPARGRKPRGNGCPPHLHQQKLKVSSLGTSAFKESESFQLVPAKSMEAGKTRFARTLKRFLLHSATRPHPIYIYIIPLFKQKPPN